MFDLISMDDLLSGRETNTSDNPIPRENVKLGIFGSRSLKDKRVLDLIDKHVNELNAHLIITAAEPAGVCQLAQFYCKKNHFPLQVHFLQTDKYAKGCWWNRSAKVIEASDVILLIHDGESRGTYNEMQETMKFEKPYRYERLPCDCSLPIVGKEKFF